MHECIVGVRGGGVRGAGPVTGPILHKGHPSIRQTSTWCATVMKKLVTLSFSI